MRILTNGVKTIIVNIGVIGYGYWGSKVTRAFASCTGARIVSICDRDDQRLRLAQTNYPRVAGFPDYQQLLKSPIDAVYIATPLSTHFEIALAALEQGKHVLVEKPMVSHYAQAQTLVDLADELARILMVGHTFLYDPAIRVIRRLVVHQEVGQILYINATRTGLGLFRQDADVIWDLASHDIAILRYVLGEEPTEVSVWGKAMLSPEVTDVAYLCFRFASGVIGFVHVSRLDAMKERKWNVVGRDGIISLTGVGKEATIDTLRASVKIEPVFANSDRPQTLNMRRWPIHQVEPILLQCGHFIHCIQRGQQPLTNGYDGLRVVQILEAASKSLIAGGVGVPISQS